MDPWLLYDMTGPLIASMDIDGDGKIFIPTGFVLGPPFLLGLWMIARTFSKDW